jgi:outer membrane protein assembly factor BamB
MTKLFVRVLFALAVAGFYSPDARSEDWARFRGANGTGLSNQTGFPTTWDASRFEWNIELPGIGHSSPIVWGNALFVTSAVDEGAVRYLHRVDTKTGRVVWTRQMGLRQSHKHLKNSWASGTPATDGNLVYVPFADREQYTVSAFDFDGNLVWRRFLGSFQSQHGQGASPILFEDLVIVPNDQQGPSSIVALDKSTGKLVWSSLRSFRKTSYSTPILLKQSNDDQPQLICVSGRLGVTSLDPRTGELNWASGEFPMRTVASPIFANGMVIASCGGGGKGKLMIGVDPGGKGDVAETHIRFKRDRSLPYVPTPVAYKGHLYLWNDNGVVTCIHLEDQQEIWTKRVGGNFSGSPICVDGRLYCMSEDGEVVVIDASPEYHLHGKTTLGDNSHSTPAVANGHMYLRTFKRLMSLPSDKTPSL